MFSHNLKCHSCLKPIENSQISFNEKGEIISFIPYCIVCFEKTTPDMFNFLYNKYINRFSEKEWVCLSAHVIKGKKFRVYSKTLVVEVIKKLIDMKIYSISLLAHSSAQIFPAQIPEPAHGSSPIYRIGLEPRAEPVQSEPTLSRQTGGITQWL